MAEVTPENIVWSSPYHFEQSKIVNVAYGGIVRRFEPLGEDFRGQQILCDLIRAASQLVGSPTLIGVHAIQTEAIGDGTAYPAPEGIHQDGFAYISIHLCKKKNIDGDGAVNDLYEISGERLLGEITLEKPGDSLFIDDLRLRHCVTPFRPADQINRAYRDIFVFTYGPALK